MENMDINRTFWLDRPTFVTGATGLVGNWLVRRLVEAKADCSRQPGIFSETGRIGLPNHYLPQ